MESETYGLSHFRRQQLAAARVRDDTVVVDTGDSPAHSGDSAKSRTWWRIGPGDDEFLTQTVQVHFVELPPDSSNRGHGHQNEASFYILEGRGYEIHDGQRYDWKKGDLVFVHTDSVHRHYNPYDERAVALVMKAKCTWMFMGMIQQGPSGPIDRPDEFGEREDWSRVWTPGVTDRKKVITPEDGFWETTQLGRMRVINSAEKTDQRQFSVDVYELTLPGGSHSGRYWKMADEILYILDGEGYSLHWEVEAEIAEKYYARIAKEPTRHDFKKDDTLYIPQNTIAQHFAADGTPVHMLSVQNRIFKHLGYDKVHYLEDSTEYVSELAAASAAS
jgi:quercetin dioxygenase-like cupin family protein